jgi:NAD(P)-dependent dehydrogenase (short-subunit alcohol dehydrogenase family)
MVSPSRGDGVDEVRFDGQIAVVTGAGRGIGRAEAQLLAARGARVVVNDWGRSGDGRPLEEEPGREVCAAIESAGGRAVLDTSDVGTPDGAAAVIDRAIAEWGRIDVLVNNAGSAVRAADPGSMTDDGMHLTVRTHLLATMWTCRRAWPVMVEQGYGRIVNTSSATMLGVKNSWDYPAAKGGVLGFTRSLAVTAQPHGIMVNAIMPMAYTRPMHSYPDEAIREWMKANFSASDIAPLVAFLASESVPCTGEVFAVGAGRCARLAIVAAPGYQKHDGPLSIEDVAANWDTVVDLTDAVLMRHSRDESAMYRGEAEWHGSNAGYD